MWWLVSSSLSPEMNDSGPKPMYHASEQPCIVGLLHVDATTNLSPTWKLHCSTTEGVRPEQSVEVKTHKSSMLVLLDVTET